MAGQPAYWSPPIAQPLPGGVVVPPPGLNGQPASSGAHDGVMPSTSIYSPSSLPLGDPDAPLLANLGSRERDRSRDRSEGHRHLLPYAPPGGGHPPEGLDPYEQFHRWESRRDPIVTGRPARAHSRVPETVTPAAQNPPSKRKLEEETTPCIHKTDNEQPSGSGHDGPSGSGLDRTSASSDAAPQQSSTQSFDLTTNDPPEEEDEQPSSSHHHRYDIEDDYDGLFAHDKITDSDILICDDPDEWHTLPEAHKMLARTASFTVARNIDGEAYYLDAVFTQPDLMERCSFYTCRAQDEPRNWGDIVPAMAALADANSVNLAYALRSLGAKKTTPTLQARLLKKRKEASTAQLRQYREGFLEAKKTEMKSWVDHQVYEYIDMRKHNVKNFVTGRWVLTIKFDKDGKFSKCKARWVLRGFQDKQKDYQQTDSPTATRPGFRLTCQHAANEQLDLMHIDLKTAFLQGEAFDDSRDVVCQLPPELGQPSYIGARMLKPGYGLNDAPRRWWSRIDDSLRSYGLVPTRADRCCYVLYHEKTKPGATTLPDVKHKSSSIDTIASAIDYLTDPVNGSPSVGRSTSGVVCLHVDDLFMTGDSEFQRRVYQRLIKEYDIGSEDKNDVEFVGQRVRWVTPKPGSPGPKEPYISVDQHKKIEELAELKFDKSLRQDVVVDSALHTSFRSVLGQINWLQSRTQMQSCYAFSRCASASAGPTIGDCLALNKLVRTIRSQPVELRFFTLKGNLRMVGFPDAAYRNNPDQSTQRGAVICLCEPRRSDRSDARGCIIEYESHKINRTVLSTTVAELYAFQKVYGTCQFLRGLWMDISCHKVDLHMRTDANNLVTTAGTTHLPEQKETVHMIQMLRKEAVSGSIDDLGHIDTAHMLADPLTKASAKPTVLIDTIIHGLIKNIDNSPEFRSVLKHKAYLVHWMATYLDPKIVKSASRFLDEDVEQMVHVYYAVSSDSFANLVNTDLYSLVASAPSHNCRFPAEPSADALPDALFSAPKETDVDDATRHTHTHTCDLCHVEYTHCHEGPLDHDHCHERACCNPECARAYVPTSSDNQPIQ